MLFRSKLGDYSYTLYLIHSNIILFVFFWWKQVTHSPPGTISGLMAFVLCMGAFWFMGQVDVTLHKRLKGWVNRNLADGYLPMARRLVLQPIVSLVSKRSEKD